MKCVYRCPVCGKDFPAGGPGEVFDFAEHCVEEHGVEDVAPGDCARSVGVDQ